MNLKWNKTSGLNQEDNHYELCLVKKTENDDYVPISKTVKCKDFIQDLFYIARSKDNIDPEYLKRNEGFVLYGYKMDTNDSDLEELNKDILYLAVKSKEDILFSKDQYIKSQLFMNYYDSLFNISKTEVIQSDDNITLLFKYSKDWTNELYMLSLFTLLSRCSVKYNYSKVSNTTINNYLNDLDLKNRSMLRTALPQIDKLLDNNYKVNSKFNYNSKITNTNYYIDTTTLHHRSGILSTEFIKNTSSKPKKELHETIDTTS